MGPTQSFPTFAFNSSKKFSPTINCPASLVADVRMLQAGDGLDLAQETLGTDHGGEFGAKDLDGDLAIVFQILGEAVEWLRHRFASSTARFIWATQFGTTRR